MLNLNYTEKKLTYKYQIVCHIVRFIKNENSMLYNKPLTTIALAASFSGIFTTTGFLIVTILRWKTISPLFQKKEFWISTIYGVFIGAYFGNSCVSLCNILSSPLFVSNTRPLRLVFGIILSYFILSEVLTITQYVLCGFMFK
ncbi:LOW QUALITY PROTEIN: hypothetical protein HZS_453 [Henneguya salminicola]|nr:LOW QUALITY PROTEIN: hypothetical protein HZS_453 [Henneguya salminicola]